MVYHPVLINKYKVNHGTKVKNKQARGTLQYLQDFIFFFYYVNTMNNCYPCKSASFHGGCGCYFIQKKSLEIHVRVRSIDRIPKKVRVST